MNFLDEKIEEYALRHTTGEPDVLKKLSRETQAKILFPRMLSGHLQGRLLSMISHMVKPGRILEIGTYTGYSCICLAEGLQKNGLIHTIEINEELERMIRRYFKEAGISKKVNLHLGSALEVIPSIKETFDLVFIDADKENYSRYYDLVFPKLRKGGFIIADNVLWSGKVLEKAEKQDADTKALVAFGKKVQEDRRVENLLLPVRDGLMIARKL
jgi:caffeoyl-CoA O-methyltransferase